MDPSHLLYIKRY